MYREYEAWLEDEFKQLESGFSQGDRLPGGSDIVMVPKKVKMWEYVSIIEILNESSPKDDFPYAPHWCPHG